MFTAPVITKTIALLAAVAATQAVPLESRKKHTSDMPAAVDAADQPLMLLEIHPGNRTDLCLTLSSIIPPTANQTLALVDCNAVTPNNATAYYKYWVLQQSEGADKKPASGVEIRLNGTDLCLDYAQGVQNESYVKTCGQDVAAQQFTYSKDKQIMTSQNTTCLGVGLYNAPTFQACSNETWSFEATPSM